VLSALLALQFIVVCVPYVSFQLGVAVSVKTVVDLFISRNLVIVCVV